MDDLSFAFSDVVAFLALSCGFVVRFCAMSVDRTRKSNDMSLFVGGNCPYGHPGYYLSATGLCSWPSSLLSSHGFILLLRDHRRKLLVLIHLNHLRRKLLILIHVRRSNLRRYILVLIHLTLSILRRQLLVFIHLTCSRSRCPYNRDPASLPLANAYYLQTCITGIKCLLYT